MTERESVRKNMLICIHLLSGEREGLVSEDILRTTKSIYLHFLYKDQDCYKDQVSLQRPLVPRAISLPAKNIFIVTF